MRNRIFRKPLPCLVVVIVLLSLWSACNFGSPGEEPQDDWITVSYYLNDGNGNMMEFYFEDGSSSVSFDPPTRVGFVFNGLFSAAEGGNMIFDANGQSVAIITGYTTLYAQWTPLSYTLVFDAGDGTLTNSETERPVLSGSGLSVFLGASCDGYTFVGWKNARGELVSDKTEPLADRAVFDLYTYPADEDGKVILTAAYELKTCTVTFDFGDGRIETQSLYWGSPTMQITYPAEDTGSAEIVSWSLATGVQIDYADETVTGDITFYAIWRDYKVFTFHLGDGMENVTERVYNGVNFKAPTPEREGYVFSGWYNSDVFAGFPEQSISYYSYYSDFYAKWTLDTYTVNFELYGGTGDLTPLTYDCEHALALPVVEKDACVFLGWCRMEDLSDPPMTEIPVGCHGNITLYAKYEGQKTFIYLDAGEGKASSDSATVEYSAWNYLPVPDYDGHIFRGWYLGDTQMTDGDGKTLTLWGYQENGMTLTARYARAYTLTVEINDEKGATLNVDRRYAEGDSVLLDLIAAEGWTVISMTSDLGYAVGAGETFTMPPKDITFTITVKPNTYTVTLSAGANAYLKTDKLTVDMNGTVLLPTPAYQGHRFIGWFYGNEQVTDAGGALLSENGWSIAADAILTAQYEYDGNTCEFIQSADDLLKMRDNPGGTYRLLCDIYVDSWETVDFSGSLDGGGYTLSGLTTALFNQLTGTVKNLTLDVNIDTSGWPSKLYGGVACDLKDNGTVINVTVKGAIKYTGTADVGGIIGCVHGQNTTVTGCVNYASILVQDNDGWSVGGIVGAMQICPSPFSNNVNYGDVSNPTSNAGGIAGWINADGIFSNCENYAEKVNGKHAGGIIGHINSGTLTVDGCTTRSVVDGEYIGKYAGYVGGNVRYQDLPAVTVRNATEFVEAVKYNIPGEDIFLASDIDLAGVNWVPTVLSGNLIGSGHTIRNLSLTSSEGHVGLFTTVKGSIEDLILSNFTVVSAGASGCARVGALCGEFKGGTISGVTLESGMVTAGVADCGGIIGYLSGGSVTDCVNYAGVTAAPNGNSGCVGGIVGYMPGGTLSDCENHGMVQGTYRVGGICGGMEVGGENFTKNHISNGAVIGTEQVGGLYGFYSGGTLTVKACAVNADIVGTKNVGRYVGRGNVKYVDLPVTTVDTAKELLAMRWHVAEDMFILQNDISLNGCNWITSDFSAVLDGNGHKITGLTSSLFETVTGRIANLEVHYEITVTSPDRQEGGVACALKGSATVTNVTTYGSILAKGNCDLGGIVGYAYDQSVISDCTNYADVTISDNSGYSIGGVCGAATYATNNNRNSNYGDVTNATGNAGGVFGYIDRGDAIQTEAHNGGSVTGKYAGGIVAVQNSGTLTIDNCTSEGPVAGTSNTGKFVSKGKAVYQNLSAITVSTVEELMNMSLHVADEIYVLGADLDLSNVIWTAFDFSATFDGNGHKIIGQTTHLFNKITGTVQNLVLDSVNIEADGQTVVAALSAEVSGNALIENVTAYGNIKATNVEHAGGLISRAYNNSVIRNCTSYLNVDVVLRTSDHQVGGVLGAVCSGHAVTVENCTNFGNVTGNYNVGGVIGWYNGTIPVTGCANYGTITCAQRAGGIVGYAYKAVVIDGCGSYGEFGEGSVFGKYVGGGKVTYQNLPVEEIATYEDLVDLKYNIAEESYLMVADIDMTGKTWIPMALYAKLDANGHKITGLTLTSASGNLALFTTVSGSVENLILENINVTSTSYDQVMVAGLCEELTGGSLKNITVSGSITAQAGRVAGLVAKQSGGVIENCINYASIKSRMTEKDGSAAGVIGWFAGGTVKDCQNHGKIEKQHYTGGVIGYMTCMDATNLTNYGEIKGEYDTGGVVGYLSLNTSASLNPHFLNLGKVTGKENVGGIFGRFYASNGYDQTLILNHLENQGEVVGGQYVGGIFGYFRTDASRSYNSPIFTATLSEITNTGNVTGESYVGGIAGYGSTDTGKSTFIGLTSSAQISGKYYVGGIAGRLDLIVLDGCSNAGSAVTSTGYLIENSEYFTYLGGYVGYGYGLTNCVNDMEIDHTRKGSYVGGLAGVITGEMNSCTNHAPVSAPQCDYVGGLVGYAYVTNTASFANNENNGKVSGHQYVGGLLGKMYATNAYDQVLTMQDFTNNGEVTGSSASDMKYVGGIIGHLYAQASRDYNSPIFTINITNFQNTGDVTGVSYVGGLIGYGASDTGASKILDSASSADITAEYYVGGLAGELDTIQLEACSNEGSTVTVTGYFVKESNYMTYAGGYVGRGYIITDCHNALDMTNKLKGSYVGGLAGYTRNAFSGCTNTGDVYAPQCSYVGGLVGYAYVDTTQTFEENRNSGAVTGKDYVGGVVGRMYAFNGYDQTLTLNNFRNSGAVEGSESVEESYVGGIIGHLSANAARDYNSPIFKILVTEFNNTGSVKGYAYVGGLLGYGSSDTGDSLISDSVSSAEVTAAYLVGGLAGKLDTVRLVSCSNDGSAVTATGYFIDDSAYYTYLGGYVGYGYIVNDCANAVDISYDLKGSYVGGVAGYLYHSFSSCTNSGDVSAPKSDLVGGLVGYAHIAGSCTVEQNRNTGDVTGYDRVGGIAGELYAENGYDCTLELKKQTNAGNITGNLYVGGIGGYMHAQASRSYASPIFTIMASELNNTGAIQGSENVGGLGGYISTDSSSSSLTGHLADGTVTCNGEYQSETFAEISNFIIKN